PWNEMRCRFRLLWLENVLLQPSSSHVSGSFGCPDCAERRLRDRMGGESGFEYDGETVDGSVMLERGLGVSKAWDVGVDGAEESSTFSWSASCIVSSSSSACSLVMVEWWSSCSSSILCATYSGPYSGSQAALILHGAISWRADEHVQQFESTLATKRVSCSM